MNEKKTGLVLTAGGARGAYQAGVLKRVGEIASLKGKPLPFSIIAGASAGAINGAALASRAEDFTVSTIKMCELWSNIKSSDVFKTDLLSITRIMKDWAKDLSLGGVIGGGKAQSLLDASPLPKLIERGIDFNGIQKAIDSNILYAIAISATNYFSGKSFTFIQGAPGHPVWEKSRRIALTARLNVEHIWASSAIPIVFQPVLVHTQVGDFYFGDGGLRLVTPISPAIRLGADKVFAVGVRSQRAVDERSKIELINLSENKSKLKSPPLAQVIGVVLNSIFLDHLDTDIDHLRRINEIAETLAAANIEMKFQKEPIRKVGHLTISPSIDLAKIAEIYADRMPTVVRYVMDGLGASRSENADLMSYLLFEKEYTGALIDLGYRDADERIDEVESFISHQTI